jgi:uncharacterized protein (TIGR03435 family)
MRHGQCERHVGARTAGIAAVILASTLAAFPAGQQSQPAFEVTSIKENKTGTNRMSMNVLPGGRFVATNVTLETLVAGAYGGDTPLPPNRLVLPAPWAGSGPTVPRFDIDAKPSRPFGPGELLAAVRQLLADRFTLVVHHEMREQPGYALVVAREDGRLGARLKRSDVDCDDPVERTAKEPDGTLRCGIRGRAGSATGRQTMAVLARFLTNLVPDHRTVEDQIKLVGTYEFQLDWAPEGQVASDATPAPAADPNAVSVFTAVREQLGLRLDSAKQQVDVVIVDRVERPTED